MIRQHYLQQERLKYNHQRLLDRFNHIHSPHISQFRSFGTSSLPGRNYEQHLSALSSGNHPRRDSLVAQSRASINSSGETYQWMNSNRPSENLPRNVSSVIQYTRKPTIPLVHAERFEPVQVYEHPIFGPTPAYIRPIFNEETQKERTHEDSDTDEDQEVSSINERPEERRPTPSPAFRRETPAAAADIDDDDLSDHVPKGYISHKKWKAKYENILPVNPLLFNIYTQRPNGSIQRYGESLYAPANFNRGPVEHDDFFSPAASENDSVASEIPRVDPSALNRRYSRLQPQPVPSSVAPRSLEPMDTVDSFNDETSPPDSPVPYLSRTRINLPTTTTSVRPTATAIDPVFPRTTPLSTTNIPSTPLIPSSTTITTTNLPRIPSASSIATVVHTTDTSTIPPAPSVLPTTNISPTPLISTATTTSNIPPAPPLPSTLTTTNIPPAPPLPSTLTALSTPPAPPIPSIITTTTTSSVPPAPLTLTAPSTPPAPRTFPSLSAPPPVNAYQTPTNLPVSTAAYQVPTNVSVPSSQSAPPIVGSTGPKAVTFGGLPSAPPVIADISSSSDSEDEEQQKRRRRKKRQDAGGDADSSSSDD